MKPVPQSFEFVYLASQSPRRAQLLGQIGVKFELLLPRPDEDAEALEDHIPGELPTDYVQRVTRAKLTAARQRLRVSGRPVAPILCSDTTVALGRRIFGKPVDAADAMATLQALSGRTHRVITAVAVSAGSATHTRTHVAVSISHVKFGAMPRDTIERYIDSGEPFGKAGAYAIQSAIAAWIERIDGSYSAIMGLPLFETAHLLRQARVRF
jgi:septum formation protein